MTEQECELENLKLRQSELKLEAFEVIEMFLEMTPQDLNDNCGHKSLGAALEYTARDTIRKSHNLAKIYLAKYPD